MKLKEVRYKEKERILNSALLRTKAKQEFSGSSPTPFIGRFGYPNVSVGILSPPETKETWKYDAPKHWAKTNATIREVVHYRTQLIHGRQTSHIKHANKITEIAQDIAMAIKPVDINVTLAKKPALNIKLDQYHAPTGPSARLKKIKETSNPRIPTKIQKAHYDTDLKAQEAITSLAKHYDENHLTRMLSTGTFGIEKNRKLVPTRWSITAVDDMISKEQLKEIKEYKTYDYCTYFGGYLGNYYLLMFFPEQWSYELFELYAKPGPILEYSTDHEEFTGRKNYAEKCAGGYYTARLAITEKLKSIKKQAKAIAIRFITDEYIMPLGVWVTREATRKALSNKPIKFSSKELMITYAKHLAQRKFGINIEKILKKSKLQQKTLKQFSQAGHQQRHSSQEQNQQGTSAYQN